MKDMFDLVVDGAIWMGNGEIFENGRMLIKDGKICAVGSQGDYEDFSSHSHVDYSGKWVYPGLIDTHAHLIFGVSGWGYEDYIRNDGKLSANNADEIRVLRAARNAQTHRAVGVTTLRDSGSINTTVLSLRDGIENGYVDGPRILPSGRPITSTGGHFWWCNEEADGVDAVREAVRNLVKDGVDFIKIMASGGGTKGTDPKVPAFSQEELSAIVEEAHQYGLKCSAHCEATQSVKRAVEAGVDAIEHAGFQEPDGTRTYCEDVVEKMVEKGLAYSPTIQTAFQGLRRYSSKSNLSNEEKDRLAAAQYKLRRKLENLGEIISAGVPIIAGTDAIREFGDYVTGLELFVHAGLSSNDALKSATSVAAKEIGLAESIGTLSEGKFADFIVVDGKPHKNISELRNVLDVYQSGTKVDVPSFIDNLIPEYARAGHVSDIDSALNA